MHWYCSLSHMPWLINKTIPFIIAKAHLCVGPPLLATAYSNNGPILDRKNFETGLSVNWRHHSPPSRWVRRSRSASRWLHTTTGGSIYTRPPVCLSPSFFRHFPPFILSNSRRERSLNPYRSIRIHEGRCELSAGISKRGGGSKQRRETGGSDPFLAIVFGCIQVDSSVNLATFLIPPKRFGFWQEEMDRGDENSRGVAKPASFRGSFLLFF